MGMRIFMGMWSLFFVLKLERIFSHHLKKRIEISVHIMLCVPVRKLLLARVTIEITRRQGLRHHPLFAF